MKLNQLGLTKTGQVATKKLTHQVHKATVAAAMEPKLKLGVIGIEIGQEQSTGLTSRVNEVASPVEELIRLVYKLANILKYEEHTHAVLPPASNPELWKAAIAIGRHFDKDESTHANAAWYIMQNMKQNLKTMSFDTRFAEMVEKLEKLGVMYGPLYQMHKKLVEFQQAIDLAEIETFQDDLKAILDFFDWAVINYNEYDFFDSFQKKMIFAVFTKLAFQI